MNDNDHSIVQALQLLRNGQWDAAHDIVQQRSDPAACRVHALLHRVEGDDGNAAYWYRRAGQTVPEVDTDRELDDLITEFDAG